MLLFAGLGNPGTDYAGNRHNAGFMALDQIAGRHEFSAWKSRSDVTCAEGRLGQAKVLLVKPQSFMNKSGGPVGDIARFYKIPSERVFVFYDEIDLVAGKVKVKRGGGHSGHNGIRDIDRHIGTDYWRIRIGVGRPEQLFPKSAIDIRKWVLMDFTVDERNGWVPDLLAAIASEADRLVELDDAGFMSRVAYLAPAPKHKSEEDAQSDKPESGKRNLKEEQHGI
ncbi:MAG: aminoacyl-tRNA hydrolase [Gammaproteobacteria bacterium]|nr:aminoacyl-tRNA hydrolase [Gammaproteobacteria bacterium]